MLNANKARELSLKTLEKEITERKLEAKKMAEKISKDIEMVAETGKRTLTVSEIPHHLRAYIIDILKDNAYTVTILNSHSIVVIW